ncbi:hypothetical protein AAG570_001211 [Ranatra chinensis]|uniref:Pre-C2HC domain-containing protein n=1 Tax=Ranatra chinensis TaxID=642074 RepID=A0ABD0YMX7_9HEMI
MASKRRNIFHKNHPFVIIRDIWEIKKTKIKGVNGVMEEATRWWLVVIRGDSASKSRGRRLFNLRGGFKGRDVWFDWKSRGGIENGELLTENTGFGRCFLFWLNATIQYHRSNPTSPQRPVEVHAPGTPPEEEYIDLPGTSSGPIREPPITLPVTPSTVLRDMTGNHPDAASATATCKPPPIHIAEVSDFVGLCTAIAALVGPDGFECKSRLREVMVSPSTPSNYRAIITYLSSKNYPYHTYQIKTDKAYRVVFRDLHQNTPLDIIRREIENHGHRVRAVSNVLHPKTKERLPLFFIDLEPAANNAEIFKLKKIYFSSIRIEEPHKRRDIVQCTRCQQYRHTKGYCNRPARCVRCGGEHESATCIKTRETAATCALCGGDHPANYKGCNVYKDLQKITKPLGNRRDIPPATREPISTHPPAPPVISCPPPRAVVSEPPAGSRPTAQGTTSANVTEPNVNHPHYSHLPQPKPHTHPAPSSFPQVVSKPKTKNRPATTTPFNTPHAQHKISHTLPPTGASTIPAALSSNTTPVLPIQIATALASFTNEFRTLASDLIAALTSLSSLLTTLTSAHLTIYNQYGNQ